MEREGGHEVTPLAKLRGYRQLTAAGEGESVLFKDVTPGGLIPPPKATHAKMNVQNKLCLFWEGGMDLGGVAKADGYGQLALYNILRELITNWGNAF